VKFIFLGYSYPFFPVCIHVQNIIQVFGICTKFYLCKYCMVLSSLHNALQTFPAFMDPEDGLQCSQKPHLAPRSVKCFHI